jgi:hemerythrin superfamily protein
MGIFSKLFHRDHPTDVLELLTSQHEEVDALFEALESREGDRRALFTELADKLAAHAAAEEKVFYPAIMAKETNELLQESVEEHLAIKRVLSDLITMNLDDDSFYAKLSVLKEQVAHHAHKEEEEELFPKVKKLFNADERLGLGNEVLAVFEKLMEAHPYRKVPSETAMAAKLPAAPRR